MEVDLIFRFILLVYELHFFCIPEVVVLMHLDHLNILRELFLEDLLLEGDVMRCTKRFDGIHGFVPGMFRSRLCCCWWASVIMGILADDLYQLVLLEA